MANNLVPYTQDEQKWMRHYMTQAMKQIKPKEMTKKVKEERIHPNYVLPTMQLVAQAESEMKRQHKESPVYAPIKATPEFESNHSVSVTTKGNTRKRKAKSHTNTPSEPKKKRAQHSTTKSAKKDIFH